MSLVGPRPEDPEIVAGWPEEVRQEVLSVRPGVTSPASVLYRDEEALLSGGKVMETYLADILPSKLRLDQLYVRHRSLWGDLDILFWTLLVLIPRVRTYSPPEDRLFFGPLSSLMRHHVSWFLIDTLVTFAAMGLTGLFWRSFGPLDVGWSAAIALAIGFAMLFSFTNVLLGVNRIEWSRAASTDALDLLPGSILATIIALLVNYFYPIGFLVIVYRGDVPDWLTRPLLPPGLILMASGLAILGFVIVRYRSRLVTGLATRWVAWRGPSSATQERVLIIGGGETGQFAAWMLKGGTYSDTLQVIGFADDDLYKQGIRIHGVNVLGKRAEIPDLVREHDIGIIVFAIHNITAGERRRVLEICANTPARLVLFPDIPAALSGLARNGGGPREKVVEKGGKSAGEDPASDLLPCYLCLTKVSPLRVDGWLAQLEEIAVSGDLESLQARIQALREQVHGDAAIQLAANLGKEVE
jgi:hypothetical protein